ncbi:MAG: hypothetical protein IE933_11810 [Sphingomonadales bacterium]|nr:hypothetical protein [Sphingomonadales bacterium]MBD3773259.1 hypothetical protein [Paracoccaceae bacterium]
MSSPSTDRRGLIGAGALIAGAGLVAGTARAQEADTGGTWKPAMEEQDAWMEIPGTRHRFILDATATEAAGSLLGYADNYYRMNKLGYGLEPDKLGVIVVLRHLCTPYGYSDAIWSKHGKLFAKVMKLDEELAKIAESRNPLLTPSDDDDTANLTSLHEKGALFAICGAATHFVAQAIAKNSDGDAGAIEQELKEQLVPGGVMVPAGIVAVNRAQERGYAFAYVSE